MNRPFGPCPQEGQLVAKKLKIVYTNADSLSNKMRNLEILSNCESPDIISVTEINPKHTRVCLCEREIHLDGYTLYTNLHVPEKGRGVAIYVKENMTCSVYTPTARFQQSVWLDLVLENGQKARIGVVYRSPNSEPGANAELIEQIREVCNDTPASMELIITGDFNCRDWIDWSTLSTTTGEQHIASRLLEMTIDCTLTQHVNKPTHIRHGQAMNTLDLVLTRLSKATITEPETDVPLGSSYHCVLRFTLNYDDEQGGPEPQRKAHLLFEKGNYTGMKEELSQIDWDELLLGKNTEGQWSVIKETLDDIIRKYVPKKSYGPNARRNFKPLWLNPNALRKVKAKHEAFKRYMQSKDGDDYQRYVAERNAARREIRKAVREHERLLSKKSKRDPKSFWKYTRRKSKPRSRLGKLKVGDRSYDTDSEKANVLNDYFSSVFTHEDLSDVPECSMGGDTYDEIGNLTVTPDVVKKKLLSLNPQKSPGPDGLHPYVLKALADDLAYPLASLYNTSLQEGVVPNSWKEAYVTPIFKKGDKADPGNYRPVSLTSIPCKVLESIIRDHLLDHLMSNNLIDRNQYGFMAGKSCGTNLLDCMEDWAEALDKGYCIDVIYLDLRKAFDTVPHVRLCKKLEALGITGTCLNWIKDFLLNRKQAVNVNGSFSSSADVVSGVPQGSVLGPLLFTCFINDITRETRNVFRLFADDSKLYRIIRSVDDCHSLQSDLDRLVLWSRRWQLQFNETKCIVLRIGTGHPDFTYTMENADGLRVNLVVKTEEKDLGVTISNDLKPSKHIAQITSSATRALFTLKRTLTFNISTQGATLYKAIVRPILEYSNCAWHPHTVQDIESLEKVQRRATRMICRRSGRQLGYDDRLKLLDLMSLTHRRRRGDMIEVFKYFKNPGVFNSLELQLSGENRTRGHPYKLAKLRSNTNIGSRRFSQRVVNDWNALPDHIVTAPSVGAFKARLDKHWEGEESLYNYRA